MDPKEYEAEDFLQDPSFRDFCLGNNEKAVQFWETWILENPGKTEVLKQARELYLMLNGENSPARFLEDRQFFVDKLNTHLAVKTGDQQQKRSLVGRISRIGWAASFVAAASLLVILLVPLWLQRSVSPASLPSNPSYTLVHDSKAGERKSFLLPDGTKVILNGGSKLQIAGNFNSSTREVLLSGEAFFDVKQEPHKPFIIHTASMDVRVLGTVFNIKAYPSDKQTETSLLKGAVEVILKSDPGRPILLHPNEKIILGGSAKGTSEQIVLSQEPKEAPLKQAYTIDKITFSPADSTVAEVSWTADRLVFDNDPFGEVAARLERWYNISIRFENQEALAYRFTGTFERKSLDQVLGALQLSRHFDYVKIEKKGREQIVIK